jgi:hypothetical protein
MGCLVVNSAAVLEVDPRGAQLLRYTAQGELCSIMFFGETP